MKVSEVLFGNKFERTLRQRRGCSDFSLSLDEVKCVVGILILAVTTGFQIEEIIWGGGGWQQPDMLTKILSDKQYEKEQV